MTPPLVGPSTGGCRLITTLYMFMFTCQSYIAAFAQVPSRAHVGNHTAASTAVQARLSILYQHKRVTRNMLGNVRTTGVHPWSTRSSLGQAHNAACWTPLPHAPALHWGGAGGPPAAHPCCYGCTRVGDEVNARCNRLFTSGSGARRMGRPLSPLPGTQQPRCRTAVQQGQAGRHPRVRGQG